MYSQCPECETRFRVTADVLRVAQGTVRCGRCGSAFNALSRLTDTLADPAPGLPHAPAEAAGEASLGNAPESQSSDFHFSAADIEQVFIASREWQRQYGDEPYGVPGFDAPEAGATAQGSSAAHRVDGDQANEGPAVEVDEEGSFEDITLEGERIVIEGQQEFDADASEQELLDAELLETQAEAGAFPPDLAPGARTEPAATRSTADLDSTDRFEILTQVPDSAYPEVADDDGHAVAAAPTLPSPFQGTLRPDARIQQAADDDSAGPPSSSEARGAASVSTTPDELPSIVAAAAAGTAGTAGTAADTTAAPAARTLGELRRPAPRRQTESAHNSASVSTEGRGDDIEGIDGAGRRRGWIWGMGALLLAIALVAQLAHFYRQDIVRDPNLGPALRAIYDRLGLPLAPQWDLAAYELRQWGASETTPAGGRMTVRASIRNRAAFAQPLPLLRLELEDRFGGTVGKRDFEPSEYLRDPAQASRLLAAGAATEAELDLADTAREAVGYRLDVCMRDAAGLVRCAQGPGR